MFRPVRAALAALVLTTASQVALAEGVAKAPSSIPELKAYAENVKKQDAGRYRALRAEIARLEAKQRTSNVIFYGGMAASTGIVVAGSAIAGKDKCDEMPEETADEMRAKASCLRKSGKIGLISLGVGAAVALGSWIASEVVSPSREDVRRAVAPRKAKRRVRVDVGGDPKNKSLSATMRLVF